MFFSMLFLDTQSLLRKYKKKMASGQTEDFFSLILRHKKVQKTRKEMCNTLEIGISNFKKNIRGNPSYEIMLNFQVDLFSRLCMLY